MLVDCGWDGGGDALQKLTQQYCKSVVKCVHLTVHRQANFICVQKNSQPVEPRKAATNHATSHAPPKAARRVHTPGRERERGGAEVSLVGTRVKWPGGLVGGGRSDGAAASSPC